MRLVHRRVLALLLDRLFIFLIAFYPVWYAELRVRLTEEFWVNPIFPPLLLFTLPCTYLTYTLLLEGLCGGRTPGKWLLGLRVVDRKGEPIGIRKSLVRNVLRIVDAFPAGLYLVGLYFMKKRGRRLGDLWANTQVIRAARPNWKSLRLTVGWIKPLAGLLAGCLLVPVLLQLSLSNSGGSREYVTLKGMVLPHLRENSWSAVISSLREAGFNSVRISWEAAADPAFIRALHDSGLHVLVGTGEGWAVRKTPEDAERMIRELGDLENIYWGIGNEDYLPELSSPREHLKEVNSVFKGRSHRPTFHAGHMILHSPDLLLLRHRGFGPMEFTDLLGFNAYPPLQAASWTGLVEMWWRDTRTNPFYAALLGTGMRMYLWTEGWLIEPLKTSAFGYPYLLNSYLQYGKLKGKPVIVTEWGAGDLRFARGQWEILRKFPELAGLFFYSWREVDTDLDGIPDDNSLYQFLREVN